MKTRLHAPRHPHPVCVLCQYGTRASSSSSAAAARPAPPTYDTDGVRKRTLDKWARPAPDPDAPADLPPPRLSLRPTTEIGTTFGRGTQDLRPGTGAPRSWGTNLSGRPLPSSLPTASPAERDRNRPRATGGAFPQRRNTLAVPLPNWTKPKTGSPREGVLLGERVINVPRWEPIVPVAPVAPRFPLPASSNEFSNPLFPVNQEQQSAAPLHRNPKEPPAPLFPTQMPRPGEPGLLNRLRGLPPHQEAGGWARAPERGLPPHQAAGGLAQDRERARDRPPAMPVTDRLSKWAKPVDLDAERDRLREREDKGRARDDPAAARFGTKELGIEGPEEQSWPDGDGGEARLRAGQVSDRKSRKKGRGSLRAGDLEFADEVEVEMIEEAPEQKQKQKQRKVKEIEVQKDVFIPNVVSVSNLGRILGVRKNYLERVMTRAGMTDTNPDLLLNAEDASLIAMEIGLNPVVDDEAAFDIYPDPPPADPSSLPPRPPIVTIMGHVDHGKTTLLDTLRHAAVAAGEAGGITQHIGAFSVPVGSDNRRVTFLDTPGHAAFTAMRARGAMVTDIVVCVVAADDGVMPQTREVLELAKREEVQLVIAINKIDKPGADAEKVKHALLAEGVQLEELGGDVPCVEVSGQTGLGLDSLVETISTIAEVADLRAAVGGGAKAEGYVLESNVDKGRGPIATVLVMRGTLKSGAAVVAGTAWCRVRQMTDDQGKSVREAGPGMPVTVVGWRDLPTAGDEVLEAKGGEEEAKKAVGNRKRQLEKGRLLEDVESINEKRKVERIEREEDALAEADLKRGVGEGVKERKEEEGPKELRLVVKGDVSGSLEAVVGTLGAIGNDEVKVRIVSEGVGEVSEGDVAMSHTAEGMVVGFNVKAPRSVLQYASSLGVPVLFEDVIYRLMDAIRARASALLPPLITYRVKGEASIAETFTISLRGRKTRAVAGCRVTNGAIEKSARVRVVRDGETKWEGSIDELKHLKKEIGEARKGMECGMAFAGFEDFNVGDVVQAVEIVETPRTV